MRDDPKSGNPSLRRRLIVALFGFLVLVLLVTSFFGKKGYMDILRAQKTYRALETELRKLEEMKLKLVLEIAELERNPEAVEKEAREKLWLMKPGEKVIVINRR